MRSGQSAGLMVTGQPISRARSSRATARNSRCSPRRWVHPCPARSIPWMKATELLIAAADRNGSIEAATEAVERGGRPVLVDARNGGDALKSVEPPTNHPRTFEEIVAAEEPAEQERWERAETFQDPGFAGRIRQVTLLPPNPLRSHAVTAPPSPLATETVEHSGAQKRDQPPHPPSTRTIRFT
jgi:hypothetical protein